MNRLRERLPAPDSEPCPGLTKQFTNLSQPLYLPAQERKKKRYVSQLRNLKLHMSGTTGGKGQILSGEESYASSESTVRFHFHVRGEEARRKGNFKQRNNGRDMPNIQGIRKKRIRSRDNVQELGALSTSEHTTRQGVVDTPKRETEHSKRKSPWQHLASNPIEGELHDELPLRAPSGLSQNRRGQAPYCSGMLAVAPECGAWTRASGFCSVAKEEKPANPARRAPAYMKERGGE